MIMFITKNTFFRQIILLAGGTAAAQLINLAILPILTRIYTPSDFGIFAVMSASVAIVNVFLSMRYENAIIAVKTDADALVGTFSVMVLACVVSLALVFFWSVIGFGVELNTKYLLIGYIVIVFSLVTCFTQALYFLCNRLSNYHVMTNGRIYGALSLAVLSISWGYFLHNFWGLLLGSLLGVSINFLYLWCSLGETKNKLFTPNKKVVKYLKDNIRFPKYLVVSSLIDRSGSQGYLILLTKLYGEGVAGSLSLYNRVAGFPSVLVGTAIGDVFKRNASEQLRKYGECKRLVLLTAAGLLVIAIIPFFLLLFFGPHIFEVVFGSEWRQAGEFARFLAPVFLLGFIVSPISSLIYLEENQKYDLYVQSILLIFLILGLGFSLFFSKVYFAIIAYAISYFFKYCFELKVCWRIASGER
nr:O180 family O-antigen flippase [Plesiomonas shigelloides]